MRDLFDFVIIFGHVFGDILNKGKELGRIDGDLEEIT